MENVGVGINALSVLKEVRTLVELAIKDVELYRDTHDSSKLMSAAKDLRDIEELLGSANLPFMIAAFEHGAARTDKTGEL